jgi:hypothetical protein
MVLFQTEYASIKSMRLVVPPGAVILPATPRPKMLTKQCVSEITADMRRRDLRNMRTSAVQEEWANRFRRDV